MSIRVFQPDDDASDPEIDLDLSDAVKHHDIERVKTLLVDGANPSAVDLNNEPVLLTALLKENEPIAVALAQSGAEPNCLTRSGESALSIAVGFGMADAVNALIAAGVDVNHTSSDFATPLSIALHLRMEHIADAIRSAGGEVHPECDLNDLTSQENSHGNNDVYQYVVPYDKDIANALQALQSRVFDRGDFLGAEHDPSSIAEALTQMGETGTRSILDIAGVAATERVGFAAPFRDDELMEYFGTLSPTPEDVMDAIEFWERLPRGCCRFLLLGRGDNPTEILFVGLTFD